MEEILCEENIDQWETDRGKEPGRPNLPYFSLPWSLRDMINPNICPKVYTASPSDKFLTPWFPCCCSLSPHLTLGGFFLWPCWHAPVCCPPVNRLHTPRLSLHACLAVHFIFTLERCFLLIHWLWTKSGLWKLVNLYTIQWSIVTSSPTKSESQAWNGDSLLPSHP